MKMNMTQWIQDVIQKKEVMAVPIMTHPGIEMNGNTVKEAVSDGRVHYNAVMKLTESYPSAAAATIMDLTTEAESFGAKIEFSDIAVPAVSNRLLPDAEAIYQLKVPSLNTGRIPAYLKANLLAARTITDRPLFSGCIGPFSLAGRLYDMSEIMVLIYENPDAAHTLLQKCTDFILKYCMALKATGANGVVMAEPAAGLMSNDDCKIFSSQYVKQIVDKVQDDEFIVVLHNCGNTGHCTEAMVATEAAAYHFGNKCRMEEVLKDVPPTALAMGNVDPVSVFKDATPEKMKEVVADLLEKTRDYPNFVLSSGCDTPPHTPAANIDAFFEALEAYNRSHQ
ncbi:MAG: uroporphyrinogen decarboxylase family protein [Prevotella sp.]|nr:uroporphyrinogen decarboxylase family protein [Prevotella sp.]